MFIGIILILIGVILNIYFFQSKKASSNQDLNLNFKLDVEDKKTTEEHKKVSCKEKLDSYRNKYNNSDIVAEMEIIGTSIKSIITQSNDNEYYLNHSLTKEYDAVGTVFMDYRVNINSRKILLYGHNSQNIDTIFHGLENYLNQEYYNQHPDITLYTDEDTVTYKIFSVMIVTNDYQYYLVDFEDSQWPIHLYNLKKSSIYDTGVSLDKNDEVLILQTCFYEPIGSYLVISAKKV